MDAQDIVKLTGSEFGYSYREVQDRCSDTEIADYVRRTGELFAPIAGSFDDSRNTEWFVRSYLALKFVLGATVMAGTARYAEDHNLQVTLPYLCYYTILNCCRSFLLTLPCLDWRGQKTIEMTHSNILNVAADKLKRLGRRHEEALKPTLWAAKEQRDLFSYRFPSTGLSVFGENRVSVDQATTVARLLTELAQINLSCLEAQVSRRGPDSNYGILELDDVWQAMRYETTAESLIDDEDYNRVGYFMRKYRAPVPLAVLATEGLVEDFFGAWEAADDTNAEYGFSTLQQWDILLDIR